MKLSIFFLSFYFVLIFSACNKKEENSPQLIFKYTFDENGARLDNLGQPASIPTGNAAQTPVMKEIGVHSIELIEYVATYPTLNTIIYQGDTKAFNGDSGIDFDQELIVKDGEVLVKIPIENITPGTYNYLRNSLGFQRADIEFYYNDSIYGDFNLTAELASFVGYKTYLSSFDVGDQNIEVDDIVSQGFWAIHIDEPISVTQQGNSPGLGTTVPNPLGADSPIAPGSCLVTGEFETPLIITGEETEDIIVEVQISINNSIEWTEVNVDGKFEPAVENLVDMGTRGLKAVIQ